MGHAAYDPRTSRRAGAAGPLVDPRAQPAADSGDLPNTVKATGSAEQDAINNLQTEANAYGADAQTAIDQATKDYDNTTGHGKTQDAVGGVNVELNCP